MEPGRRFLISKRKGRTPQTPSAEHATYGDNTTSPMKDLRSEYLFPKRGSQGESSSSAFPDSEEKVTKPRISNCENGNASSKESPPKTEAESSTTRRAYSPPQGTSRKYSEHYTSPTSPSKMSEKKGPGSIPRHFTPPPQSPARSSTASKGKGHTSSSPRFTSPPQTPGPSPRGKGEDPFYAQPDFEPVDDDLPSPPIDHDPNDGIPKFSYPPTDDEEEFYAPSPTEPFKFPKVPEPNIGPPPCHGSIAAGIEYWANLTTAWITYQAQAHKLDCEAYEAWRHEAHRTFFENGMKRKEIRERRQARKVKYENILASCAEWNAFEAELQVDECSSKAKNSARKQQERERQKREEDEARRKFAQKRREGAQKTYQNWEFNDEFETASFLRTKPLPEFLAIQAWHQACEVFFSATSTTNLAFPKPPSLNVDCRKKSCVRSDRLNACCCTLRTLFKSKKLTGSDWKKERLRWHPDKFHGLGTDVEVVECAKEMFQIFQGIVGNGN